jgi:hypothetical protein
VDVPDLGRVFVASIGAKLRGELIGQLSVGDDATRASAIFARMPDILIDSLRDPETRLLMFDASNADALAYLDPEVSLRLMLLALKQSGLHAEAEKDAAKNSDGIPSEPSISS